MANDPEPFPPPAICSERVLQYAVLDESVGFNSGHRLMFVDGKELGKVPRLAICAEKKTSKFLIYYCDGYWRSIGVSGHDSVVAAKRRAELIYPGSSAKWVEAHFTEEDVTRYLDEIWADSRCSFCGKRPDQGIESIVEAKDGNARICDKCVVEFSRK
jgi:ClpX C4-type zinc finger protein